MLHENPLLPHTYTPYEMDPTRGVTLLSFNEKKGGCDLCVARCRSQILDLVDDLGFRFVISNHGRPSET